MKRQLALLMCFIIAACAFGCKTAKDYGLEEEFQPKFPDYQYNQETVQYYANEPLAIAENGYYFKCGNILYKYDIDKEISIPMCSKAECSHNSEGCDAYVIKKKSPAFDSVSNCMDGNVMYYNNHIYMIESPESYKVYLVQYDENFNNKEILAQLEQDDSHMYCPNGNLTKGYIVNGYYYYFGMDGRYEAIVKDDYYTTVYCNRIKLEKDAKPEVLGEYKFGGDFALLGGDVGKIFISEDNVWFIQYGSGRWYSKTDTVQCNISVYNTKTNEFKTTRTYAGDTGKDFWGVGTGETETIGRTCMDKNNNLYIVSQTGERFQTGEKWQIVKVNLIDNSSSVIYISEYAIHEDYNSPAIYGLTCDGNNIFFFEEDAENKEYKMKAISLDGKTVATMELDYEDSYTDYLKKLFKKRKGREAADRKEMIRYAGTASFSIYGTDERYIVIDCDGEGIKGLSAGDSTYEKEIERNALIGVGIINKADFLSGKDCEIKQIYKYFDNH